MKIDRSAVAAQPMKDALQKLDDMQKTAEKLSVNNPAIQQIAHEKNLETVQISNTNEKEK